MKTRLEKEYLGLAGEYAVASELCRRGVYAQLTLGNHKQTDILVETLTRMLRISVKAKQGSEWPSIMGLQRIDDFLVLVDLKGKRLNERADFYILDLRAWKRLLQEEGERHPTATIDAQNRFIYSDGWKGLNIKPKTVTEAREQWGKINSHIKVAGTKTE